MVHVIYIHTYVRSNLCINCTIFCGRDKAYYLYTYIYIFIIYTHVCDCSCVCDCDCRCCCYCSCCCYFRYCYYCFVIVITVLLFLLLLLLLVLFLLLSLSLLLVLQLFWLYSDIIMGNSWRWRHGVTFELMVWIRDTIPELPHLGNWSLQIAI